METPEASAFTEPALRKDEQLLEQNDRTLDLIVESDPYDSIITTGGDLADAGAGADASAVIDCRSSPPQSVGTGDGDSRVQGEGSGHSEAREPAAAPTPTLATSPMFANSPPLELANWGTQVVAPPAKRQGAQQWVSMTDSQLKVLNIISIGTIACVALLVICQFIISVGNVAHNTSPQDASYIQYNIQYALAHLFDIRIDWPTANLPAWAGFVKNGGNMDQVLRVLPWAWFASFVAIAISAVAVYYTRPRDITCDDRNLILEGSGPLMIGVRWQAIKRISQSRTWDIFNGKRDLLTVETMGGHTFRMRVSDIARRQDIGTFFNKVRTNAPNAVLHIADEIRNAEPSYTELWLKYFSAPSERTKKGLLEPGMALDSGRYTVVETVGGGGQGTAYLAACKAPITRLDETCEHIVEGAEGEIENGMEVVLKEYVLPVHRGQLTAEKTAQKLKAEAAILRKLEHPQIVKLLDGFIEDYRGYLVLEYVQGETLKSLVDRLGPQPEQAVVSWAAQIANILTYLHELTPSVVHRDITPDNLILQEDGTIKVVDFNVAHQVDSSATATVVGKHAYIPPEQFRGKPNEQSDIYALGGTMFFLLTGSEPEPISVSRPRRQCPQVSEKMDALVSKSTALDLTRRFANARELLIELQKMM